jgi:hypothetical protein
MKCMDCKRAEADIEIVVDGQVRTVCGPCKRAAYVVYPEGEVADGSEQADAEGGLREVPAGDVHHDEAAVPDA